VHSDKKREKDNICTWKKKIFIDTRAGHWQKCHNWIQIW